MKIYIDRDLDELLFVMADGTRFTLGEVGNRLSLTNVDTGEVHNKSHHLKRSRASGFMDLMGEIVKNEKSQPPPDMSCLIYAQGVNVVISFQVTDREGNVSSKQFGDHRMILSEESDIIVFNCINAADIPAEFMECLLEGWVVSYKNGVFQKDTARTKELMHPDGHGLSYEEEHPMEHPIKILPDRASVPRYVTIRQEDEVPFGGGFRTKPEKPFWAGVHRKGFKKKKRY